MISANTPQLKVLSDSMTPVYTTLTPQLLSRCLIFLPNIFDITPAAVDELILATMTDSNTRK